MSLLRFHAATAAYFEHYVRLVSELGVDDPRPSLAEWERTIAPDTVFAELDGEFVGYGYAQALGANGYVRNVVVAPKARRRGFGRELMLELRRLLSARGCTSWQLNVKSDNEPALELYRALGLQADYRTWVLRVFVDSPLDLAPSPPTLVARESDPALDSALEREFDVPAGLLTSHRARTGARVLCFEFDGRPVAFAPFDLRHPGCFPFRLREALCARGVIEALLALVPAGRPHLQLVLERDEAAAKVLRGAGARLMFEIQHLHGALER